MSVVLASEFPENPLMIFRFGWQFLVCYYVVAAIMVVMLWRALKPSRFVHSRKHRVITAAILAAVFAPSEVSDFFLFNLPGPAIAGLLLLIVALALGAAAYPAMLLKLSTWSALIWLVAGYYILPLLVVFVIAYVALSLYSHSVVRVAPDA
jgi:hypothetical protein